MALLPQFGKIVPTQKQEALQSNYLQWTDAAAADFVDFSQQYLPEIYEQEVERYGNRTLSGFLRMVGAEMPMTSDQVIWSEQNRLHIAYDNCTTPTNLTINVNPTAAADIFNVISPRATVVVMDDFGAEVKCLVTDSNTGTGIITKGSTTPNYDAATSTTDGLVSVDPVLQQYSNLPIIIRSKYTVNGSDTAQIGWVEVATEDGTSGYLWYLKAESETRLRFEDYLEMSVVEGELAAAGSAAAGVAGTKGTQGLFAAIQERGNVQTGFTAATGLGDFDDILRNLDTQGAIEENMLFLNRDTSLDFDDMLSLISTGSEGGTAFGLFENSEDMALNLGFSGFRRGSYDFYKTDWKYLNDASTRGGQTGPASIEGVLIPAGTSTVYDQILGTNIRRPFLHVRYRASQADDRRMKSWLTGSVGGAFTSDLDAMEVNFLSERCLVVQGANNFVLFQGA
jgi:hypothetical protein